MHFQDILASLEVGKLDRYTPVKTAGSCKSRIQRFRTVGRRQNNNARIALKTIHLG